MLYYDDRASERQWNTLVSIKRKNFLILVMFANMVAYMLCYIQLYPAGLLFFISHSWIIPCLMFLYILSIVCYHGGWGEEPASGATINNG